MRVVLSENSDMRLNQTKTELKDTQCKQLIIPWVCITINTSSYLNNRTGHVSLTPQMK